MKFLKNLFNRQQSEFVKLSDLAALITPVHIEALIDNSPASVAKGFSELTEWSRIGFDAESKKGPLYEAMNIALRSLTTTLENATPINGKDGQPGVYLRRDDLRVLRASYDQMYESAHNLRLISQHMQPGPTVYDFTDRQGQRRRAMDFSRTIPIYNRPNANHALAAEQVEDCIRNLDAFFGKRSIRPANDATIHRYADMQKFFR